jgi:signal peptidase I
LNTIGATWDKNYGFGKELNIKKDCVYPGDIIQFENVKIEYHKNNTTYWEEMDHHTAVIFKVNNKESFTIAEQNTSDLGKKVGLNSLELKYILKGTYTVYRPVK